MTIYKTLQPEKKSDKEPEVLTEPLTGIKDEADLEAVTPKVVRVTYGPRHTRTYVNLCLLVAALMVLGAGIIGAIFLYKHLSHRVVTARCGVTYYDEVYHNEVNHKADFLRGKEEEEPKAQQDNPDTTFQMDFFEEDIEVSEIDKYERLTVPKFDECDETVIWHDFNKNYTAIVDNLYENCYIMKLNRTLITPPRDLIDLITKFKNGDYFPKADVVRQKYRVVTPPMDDLKVFGPFIMRECYWYRTYKLEKFVSGVYRRSAGPLRSVQHKGFPVIREDKTQILKLTLVK